jgi:hypothetical protein
MKGLRLMTNPKTRVDTIVDDENRLLLYTNDDLGRKIRYHIIASTKDCVKIGDTIEYEPYGVNFGYFIRIANEQAKP